MSILKVCDKCGNRIEGKEYWWVVVNKMGAEREEVQEHYCLGCYK